MIDVHLLAGDGNGGPYIDATLTLDRESDAITDDECATWRENVKDAFYAAFGEDPEAIIVYVDEVPDTGQLEP